MPRLWLWAAARSNCEKRQSPQKFWHALPSMAGNVFCGIYQAAGQTALQVVESIKAYKKSGHVIMSCKAEAQSECAAVASADSSAPPVRKSLLNRTSDGRLDLVNSSLQHSQLDAGKQGKKEGCREGGREGWREEGGGRREGYGVFQMLCYASLYVVAARPSYSGLITASPNSAGQGSGHHTPLNASTA